MDYHSCSIAPIEAQCAWATPELSYRLGGMMQILRHEVRGTVLTRTLPDPDEEVLPGVEWGSASELLSPAFWVAHHWCSEQEDDRLEYRIGRSLIEEAAMCLLGGHGITYELNLAAFEHVRDLGLLADVAVTPSKLEKALSTPLCVNGRTVKYRFPRLKAKYLAPVVRHLLRQPPALDSARDLRAWFMQFPGIGYKTASWIVRNWLDADDVAIIDIHIQRAGQIMRLYSTSDRVERHYERMEETFVQFANAVGIRTSILDCLIWMQMREIPLTVRRLLKDDSIAASY